MYNFIFFYHGLLAILTQLVIFRELSVLFYGSELFLGTFLSSWLFWVGLGSLSARRFLKKEQLLAGYFSYGFLIISASLPVAILLIRLSKGLFSFGEFIGPVGTVLFTFAVMSFLCFIIGAQFSLACAIASYKLRIEAALGRVYLYEALGSAAGGVLFTYVLIGTVPTFAIALALSLCCILFGLAITIRNVSVKNILLVIAAVAVLCVNFKMEPVVNRIQWRRYQFIKQKEARNSTLSLVRMGSIKNIFADGVLSASFPNPEYYEPVAHWPLLLNSAPRQVLVIGEFSMGVLKEALKHGVESVDYVVLDSSFIDLVKSYLEPEDILALNDRRVNIHYIDARIFVKNKKNKYDAVIINIQEVPNIKLNRFFTQEFYSGIRSMLKADGVLALSIASSENYLSRQTRVFNASICKTLESVFEAVDVIPGDSITFLCSPSAIDMRQEMILARFASRGISNRYFIPSYITYKLIANRRAELKKLLDDTPGIEINRDFRPTTYYYFANFWLSKFSSPFKYLMSVILLVIIRLVVYNKRSLLNSLIQRKECIIIFILGFMGILLELILLLSFQIISGYVYWQIGILFASFMSGLSLGAALGIKFKDAGWRKNFVFLIVLSLAIIVMSLCMPYFLPQLVNLSIFQNIVVFLALLAVIGLVIGSSFVIAGFLISENEVILKAGSLYAADLWGGATGALISVNFIIPVFGLLGALNFSAIAGLAGLIIFIALSKKSKLL